MKAITRYLTESTEASHKLTRTQVLLLTKMLPQAVYKFTFKDSENQLNMTADQHESRGEIYPYVNFDGKIKGKTIAHSSRQAGVYGQDSIDLSIVKFKFGYDKEYMNNCKLSKFEYNASKNETTMEFTFDNYDVELTGPSAPISGSLPAGKCTITIPCNLINPDKVNKIKSFDGKKYCEFMDSFLGKQIDYQKIIDKNEIISQSAEYNADKDHIDIHIQLETGKGYSSHSHTATYRFEEYLYGYECKNNGLYDRDHEAQIVRKYIKGLEEFCNNRYVKTVTIDIYQELD